MLLSHAERTLANDKQIHGIGNWKSQFGKPADLHRLVKHPLLVVRYEFLPLFEIGFARHGTRPSPPEVILLLTIEG